MQYIDFVGPGKNMEKAQMVQKWWGKAACPNEKCHAVGQFNNHGYYTRYFLELDDAAPNWQEMIIVRGKCKSCGRTHAVLPCDIIPYRSLLVPGMLLFVLSYFLLPGLPENEDPSADLRKAKV